MIRVTVVDGVRFKVGDNGIMLFLGNCLTI